jgi:hypothetical protein
MNQNTSFLLYAILRGLRYTRGYDVNVSCDGDSDLHHLAKEVCKIPRCKVTILLSNG